MSGWDQLGDVEDLEWQLRDDAPVPRLRVIVAVVVAAMLAVGIILIGTWSATNWCPWNGRPDGDWSCTPTTSEP